MKSRHTHSDKKRTLADDPYILLPSRSISNEEAEKIMHLGDHPASLFNSGKIRKHSHVDEKNIEAHLVITGGINFLDIHPKIRISKSFKEISPKTSGNIVFPRKYKNEIMDKLNEHPRIISIDGRYTDHGVELEQECKKFGERLLRSI